MEKCLGGVFVRNAYLESAENSVLETTLKPVALIFCVCSTYVHSMHSGYNGVLLYPIIKTSYLQLAWLV